MDQTGYDAVWLAEHHFSELLGLPVRAHDGHHGGRPHQAAADRHGRVAGPLLQSAAARRGGGAARRAVGRPRQLGRGPRLRAQRVRRLRHPGRGERVALPRDGRHRAEGLDQPASSPIRASTTTTTASRCCPSRCRRRTRRSGWRRSSTPAIEWAASQGLLDPDGPAFLARRPHPQAAPLRARNSPRPATATPDGPSPWRAWSRSTRRPRRRARSRGARRNGRSPPTSARITPMCARRRRTFGGKDPIDFYLEDVMHPRHRRQRRRPDPLVQAEIGMTYLMAAPMSGRSFRLLTDQVLPRIAT